MRIDTRGASTVRNGSVKEMFVVVPVPRAVDWARENASRKPRPQVFDRVHRRWHHQSYAISTEGIPLEVPLHSIVRDNCCPIPIDASLWADLAASGALAVFNLQTVLKIASAAGNGPRRSVVGWPRTIVVVADADGRFFWCVRLTFHTATTGSWTGSDFLWPLSAIDAQFVLTEIVSSGGGQSTLATTYLPDHFDDAYCLFSTLVRTHARWPFPRLCDRMVFASMVPVACDPSLAIATKGCERIGGYRRNRSCVRNNNTPSLPRRRRRSARLRETPATSMDSLPDDVHDETCGLIVLEALDDASSESASVALRALLALRCVERRARDSVRRHVAAWMRNVARLWQAAIVEPTPMMLGNVAAAVRLRHDVVERQCIDLFLCAGACNAIAEVHRVVTDEELERAYLRLRGGALPKRRPPRPREVLGTVPERPLASYASTAILLSRRFVANDAGETRIGSRRAATAGPRKGVRLNMWVPRHRAAKCLHDGWEGPDGI